MRSLSVGNFSRKDAKRFGMTVDDDLGNATFTLLQSGLPTLLLSFCVAAILILLS